MRQFARALSVLFFIAVPAFLFGQNQDTKTRVRSSRKSPKEIILKADESPLVKVKTPISRDRRTQGAGGEQDQSNTKPVEAPAFQVMSHPREDRLVRGRAFHGDLRTLPQVPPEKFERPEFEGPQVTPVPYPGTAASASPSTTAKSANASLPAIPAPTPIASFDGLDFLNWGAGHPPDTNGDVGPTYYIQTINTSIGIFRKSDGVRVAAFTFNSFFNGHFGNLCDTQNFGDPVVVYDTFEDRWIITDFAFVLSGGAPVAPVYQCFAVSQSGDPVGGGWNFYSIQVASSAADAFDDYPKFGIWPDGLYMSANMFNISNSAFRNVRVWAFNKAQMYAGLPTVQILSFDAPSAEFSMLPSNARLQAGTPPNGTPNYFATVFNFTNAVSIYKLHADWNDISSSTFSGPFIAIAPTAWASPPANVATPPPGTNIDTLAVRLMMQNQYTNIGTESLWQSHTVLGGAASTAAPRFYQIDVTGGTVAATTTQAATHTPDTTVNRFMPSLAVDRAGDMALGYSAASTTLNPAIRYAGRLAGDAVNSLPQTETSLIEGTGTQQTTAFTRWGDYSAMTLDPDGCTFWYTNMYYQVNGVDFLTHIGAFSFPSCTPVATGTVSGTVTASGSGNPISGATVALGSRTATTDNNGNYSFTGLPSGTYPSITASFPGFASSTTPNVVVTDGGTTTVDFSLTAAPASGCFVDTTQADFLAGVATNCDLITSPDNIILQSGPAIDQQNTNLSSTGSAITTTQWPGQTFTPSVTGTLTRLDVSLFCASNGSPCSGTNPDITVEVRTTSGGLPTTTVLASTTIPGFSLGRGTFYTATFSSPATLTAGTMYAYTLHILTPRTSGTYAANFSAGDVYPGGTRVISTNSGVTWTINITGTTTRDLGFKAFIDAGFVHSGTFVSSLKDANPAPGNTPNWGTLSWVATTPPNTNIQFQIAASNSAAGPFNFVGPDGTPGTFFTNGASLAQFNSFRYLKYQATLTTTDGTVTPSLDSVTICFTSSPGVLAPSITKKFGAPSIALNNTTSLTFNIANNDAATPLTGVAFSDNLPAGLAIASTPNLSNTCGGTATAVGGSGSVSLSGGTLATSASCTVSVNVQGTVPGVQNNSVQITSNEGGTGNTSNASITVVASPVIFKAFGAASIPLNGSTSLTFTIQNSNNATTELTGVGFTDTLPAGLVVANPNGLANNTCVRTPTALAASSLISISGISLAANGSCSFLINVTGAGAGLQNNTTGNVTSNEGGTGGTASASVKVEAPPSIAKAFNPSNIALNGTTSLTFTITNPGANVDPLTGVAFSDTLPSGLTVANGSSTVCGGTLTTTAPTGIVLSGAAIDTNSQCQFQVTVTGAASGNYTNTTGAVTSTNGGTGNTASANVSVAFPPTITKAFGAVTIPLNGTTSLTFTIQNPNTGASLTGIAFTDSLPAGLVVASTPNLNNTCGGTATAAGGSSSVSLSAGTLAANASCTVSVNIQGITAAVENNSVQVTSTEGGNGNTSRANLSVASPPSIGKGFGAPGISLNGTTSLTFNIANPNTNVTLTGIAFTDTLPAGLVVATPNGLSNACGGTATATSGSGTVSLSGGTLAAAASCTLSVTVQGTAVGVQNNSVQVTSTEGGTGNTSTASITVVGPPVITKAFGAASIPLSGSTSLTFTIQNNNGTTTLNGVGFSDTLPAGLVISTPNGVTGSCGAGTITATQNTSVVSLSGGAIASNSFCTFSINVTGTAPGLQNNTTSNVTSTEGGTGGTASASVTVVAPPSIAKAFNPTVIAVNAVSTLTLTITNPAANTVAEAGVAVTDNLPAGMVVATPNNLNNTCGGTATATAGSGTISLTGGSVATSSSCTLSVSVTSAAAATYTNTTGAVSSTNGGTGNTASATLTVAPSDLTITKTHTDPFSRGQTGATYTITVKNSGAGPTAGTVTVVDTLPNVPNTLVPTAMTGTGWTCNLGALTCTRSDALAPGASYPAITLTVNVPSNIKANVTNTATVSGGGENNTGNDTATDPTHIGPPIQLTFTSSTATVTAGQPASFGFTLDSSPGMGMVSFACGGLPSGALCSFSPPTSSQLTDTINLTITTSASSASSAPLFPSGPTYALLFPALGLVGLAIGKRSKRMRRLRLVTAVSGFVLLLALSGCGGHPHMAGTPPGTYTITVTGTGGTASGSTTVTLNVQ